MGLSASEEFVEEGIDIGRDVQAADYQQADNEHCGRFADGIAQQRCQLGQVGKERRQQLRPQPIQTEECQHHSQNGDMFAAENRHVQSSAQKQQQAGEIEAIGKERGASRSVDAPDGYQAVVEDDGRRRQQGDEEKREGIEARIVEYVGADGERRVDDFGQAEEEDHPYAAHVFGAVRNDGEKRPQVDPYQEENQGANQKLMERHHLAQAVDFVPVVVAHGLRHQRPRYGTERTVGHLDDVGDIKRYGIDTCEGQPGMGAEKERVDERYVARQDGGGHKERVEHHLLHSVAVNKAPVDAERDFAKREEIEKVNQHRYAIAEAEEQHERIERDNSLAIKQIAHQVEDADAHLAHKPRHGDAQQDAGIGLEDSQIECKEGERQQKVDVVGYEGRFLRIDADNLVFEDKKQHGEEGEADEGDEDGPSEDAVVAPVVALKEWEEPDYRCVSAQLGKAREKHCGVDHNARKAYLLLRQTVGQDEEGGEETYRHAQIVGQSPPYALSCYYAQFVMMFFQPR